MSLVNSPEVPRVRKLGSMLWRCHNSVMKTSAERFGFTSVMLIGEFVTVIDRDRERDNIKFLTW